MGRGLSSGHGAHRRYPRRRPLKLAAVIAFMAVAAIVLAQLVTHHGSRLSGQAAALNRSATPVPASLGSPTASSGATARPGTSARASARAKPSTHQDRSRSAAARPHRRARRSAPTPAASSTSPSASAYANPLRSVTGLIAERIDMGVDFGGSGPVYALGNAVITNATGTSPGWPGGGWITYRLISGRAKGLMVYLAEDVTPTVHAGQRVTSGTVIANMCNCGDGIETGWAMPDGSSAESQLPAAGAISGNGPFPTAVGLNFEDLLRSLGVPAAYNASSAPYGILPAGYPAWP